MRVTKVKGYTNCIVCNATFPYFNISAKYCSNDCASSVHNPKPIYSTKPITLPEFRSKTGEKSNEYQ